MADVKLSDFSSASVDSDTQLVGLKTVLGTSTDYRFAIADLISYIGGAAGGGVQVVKYNRDDAATAAIPALLAYSVGVDDESLEVSCNVLVTTATSHGFTVTCSYTDEGGTSRTATLNMQILSGSIVTSIANADGAIPHMGLPTHIRAKGGTTVTIATTGTFTTVTYNIEAIIKKLPNV